MREYFTLGGTPCDEECAQVGSEDYGQRMRVESRAYVAQLYRMFPGAVEANCDFRNKSFSHDFGTYHEVCITFDPNEDASARFACNVEKNLPAKWDTIAQLAIDLYHGPKSTYLGNLMTIGAVLRNK